MSVLQRCLLRESRLYSFFEVDDVISFCIYLMNEMWRNLMKITHVLFLGDLTVLTGLANDVAVY